MSFHRTKWSPLREEDKHRFWTKSRNLGVMTCWCMEIERPSKSRSGVGGWRVTATGKMGESRWLGGNPAALVLNSGQWLFGWPQKTSFNLRGDLYLQLYPKDPGWDRASLQRQGSDPVLPILILGAFQFNEGLVGKRIYSHATDWYHGVNSQIAMGNTCRSERSLFGKAS